MISAHEAPSPPARRGRDRARGLRRIDGHAPLLRRRFARRDVRRGLQRHQRRRRVRPRQRRDEVDRPLRQRTRLHGRVRRVVDRHDVRVQRPVGDARSVLSLLLHPGGPVPAGLGPLGVLRGDRPEFGMADAGPRLHQRPDEAVPDRVRHVELRKPLLARRTILHAPVHDDRDVQEPRLRVALELLQRGGDARSPEQEPVGVGRPFGHRRSADRRLCRQGPHPVDPPLLARSHGCGNRPQLPRGPSPLRGRRAPRAA